MHRITMRLVDDLSVQLLKNQIAKYNNAELRFLFNMSWWEITFDNMEPVLALINVQPKNCWPYFELVKMPLAGVKGSWNKLQLSKRIMDR